MSYGYELRGPLGPGMRDIGDGRIVECELTGKSLHVNLFKGIKRMSENVAQTVESVAQEWKSIQEIMDYAATHVKKSWTDAQDDSPKWLADIRSIRMALSTESRQIKQALADIEDFTGDEKAKVRLDRFKELVELCERFRSVQKDGTLDAVMEAILKHA